MLSENTQLLTVRINGFDLSDVLIGFIKIPAPYIFLKFTFEIVVVSLALCVNSIKLPNFVKFKSVKLEF